MMVRKGNNSKPKTSNSSTARRAPAAAAAAAVTAVAPAGPVQALLERQELTEVGLLDTYPLQSDADPFIGGTEVVGEQYNSDALSDVSMVTNPGDYGELADCMIVDPPETLPEEVFDVSEFLNPDLDTPEILQPEESSSLAPVPVTHKEAPLTDVTKTLSPATLAAASNTATVLATSAGLVPAGVTEGKEGDGQKNKRKRGGGGSKKKVVLDANGNEIVPEKKPRGPKKLKKAKEGEGDVISSTATGAAAGATAGEVPHVPPPPPAQVKVNPGRVTCSYSPESPSIQESSSSSSSTTREPFRLKRGEREVSPISPVIGLTQMHWPTDRECDPTPLPKHIYHLQKTSNLALLVYGPPDPYGVSLVSYHNLPYEKRINLTRTAFRLLRNATPKILHRYYEIEEDCVRGRPIIEPYVIDVSIEDNLCAIVTPFRGKAKIHLGTKVYAQLLKTRVETEGTTLAPPKDQGHTIPLCFFDELLDGLYNRVMTAFEELVRKD